MIYVACRGDRRIDQVVTQGDQGVVYRSIGDKRIGDPIHVSVADRGNIMTVSDYNNKKIHSFLLGGLRARGTEWGQSGPLLTPPDVQYFYAGQMDITGRPFWTGSSNVN